MRRRASPPSKDVTADQVRGWYRREVNTRSRNRKNAGGVPGLADVEPLVSKVNELRRLRMLLPTLNFSDDIFVGLRRFRDNQKKVHELESFLSGLLVQFDQDGSVQSAEDLGMIEDMRTMVALLPRIRGYLGGPAKQGRHQNFATWCAPKLLPYVEAGWRAAGLEQLSINVGSPAVAILCEALHAIDGEYYSAEAVAHIFRRADQKTSAQK